ncbi:hypothetical protein CGZ93_13705 [Enemella dayhoffiae]|uniref:DUF2505 domain-containing protein n=1 Tax=Enemella dayhoffiae TaxID=2016507 RepID=A0A255GWS3_9ACTN|nr:DUF2505 domain-containing protein [Enemella dayhoffiae]OYO19406.1 hypothetical protein CGZ93_13705 [Enemella dayhoffiae]
MDITSAATYPAEPLAVFDLFTDRSFLEEVAREQGATEWDVQVVSNTTSSRRTLPAPPQAQKFTGQTLTIVEEVAWGPADGDGSRTGRLAVNVSGQPVTMTGTVRLTPRDGKTLFDLQAVLTAKVPLLGKKIEQLAAPAVTAGYEVQERVARRRLG